MSENLGWVHTMPKIELELEILNGDDVTDDIVAQYAALFSDHYAIWGREAEIKSDRKVRAGRTLIFL